MALINCNSITNQKTVLEITATQYGSYHTQFSWTTGAAELARDIVGQFIDWIAVYPCGQKCETMPTAYRHLLSFYRRCDTSKKFQSSQIDCECCYSIFRNESTGKQKLKKSELSNTTSLILVRVAGLEPAASCSQSTRATNCATPGNIFYARLSA